MKLNIFSGLWERIVDKGAELISEVVTDKDLATQLTHEFRLRMGMQQHEYKMAAQQAEQEMFEAQQETIQAELHQSDLYTKRTRPKVARQSWYITALYAAVSTVIIPAMPETVGIKPVVFHWEVFLVLASPALTYMGVRGFEKFRHGSAL